jgi:mannose-6-phosphate isomerase-like protein (cupin superfamily)
MIPMPISIANADKYAWGDHCDGWHLVRAATFSVIEERMPPGTSEQRHWHARAKQFFYVLAGTLQMEIEGAKHELPTGFGIEIPAGLAHVARNDGTEDARFLVISSPPHQGDRRDADSDET